MYPNNRLIVNGVDLSETYGLVLVDNYTLSPPKPKTYTVDIPGGNGKLDLTESLTGDVVYENRAQEFTFFVINTDNFEDVKTRVSNYLHGKAFNYVITMDPDYTYHGRFTVSSYEHSNYASGKIGCIKISIEADPYKRLPATITRFSAVGGILVYFESGRMRVRPTIEAPGPLKVIYNGNIVKLPEGTWTINDLVFQNGLNKVYFNSFDIRNITWGALYDNNITWGAFKTKHLFEWYKSNGDQTEVMKKWSDVANNTWSSLSNTKWSQLTYMGSTTSEIKDVYIKYERGDL